MDLVIIIILFRTFRFLSGVLSDLCFFFLWNIAISKVNNEPSSSYIILWNRNISFFSVLSLKSGGWVGNHCSITPFRRMQWSKIKLCLGVNNICIDETINTHKVVFFLICFLFVTVFIAGITVTIFATILHSRALCQRNSLGNKIAFLLRLRWEDWCYCL